MATVHKSQAEGKGHNTEEIFFYINVINIENKEEQEKLFKKIKTVVESSNGS